MQTAVGLRAPPACSLQQRRAGSSLRRSSAQPVRCMATSAALSSAVPTPLIQLAATATGMVRHAVGAVRLAAAQAARQTAEANLNEQIRASVKQMRMLAVVAPFAAATGSADTFFIITKAVASFIKLYLLLLFVRVLLSWFPTFTWWEQQPFLALRQVTDPYLKLFSGLVPPLLGTIDLTPLLGFFILQFLAGALDVSDEESRYW